MLDKAATTEECMYVRMVVRTWTVIRKRSPPKSATRIACSTVAITSRVSVVPIVWQAMGCSDPMGTLPAQIVLLLIQGRGWYGMVWYGGVGLSASHIRVQGSHPGRGDCVPTPDRRGELTDHNHNQSTINKGLYTYRVGRRLVWYTDSQYFFTAAFTSPVGTIT